MYIASAKAINAWRPSLVPTTCRLCRFPPIDCDLRGTGRKRACKNNAERVSHRPVPRINWALSPRADRVGDRPIAWKRADRRHRRTAGAHVRDNSRLAFRSNAIPDGRETSFEQRRPTGVCGLEMQGDDSAVM